MRNNQRQSGFSLMELLVTVAVILILISALVGTGSYVRTRANIDLTKGMLETLSTALEQYYNDQAPNAFPFDTPDKAPTLNGFLGDDYVEADLIADIDPTGTGILNPAVLPLHSSADTGPDSISSASSVALFYFLDKNPASRAIVEDIANSLVTNKAADGITPVTITIGANPPVDLPRYIDPWKTSIRYVYLAGTAFPVLTSAGPDKTFDTPDDITSK